MQKQFVMRTTEPYCDMTGKNYMSLSDRSENLEFVSLMKRFANMLDWSIPLQNLYDELDVDLGDYDRFKTSVHAVLQQLSGCDSSGFKNKRIERRLPVSRRLRG